MTKHTQDLDAAFFPKLVEIAGLLKASPRDMLAVMFSESGVRATAKNPHHDANGLIQFMGPTLKGLGWTAGGEQFRMLTATQQLPWVLRYYKPHTGLLGSVAALYVATFLPAFVKEAGNPDYVLVMKGGKLSWAYDPNVVFDANRDGRITVRELEEAVMRNCRGARWDEILMRLDAERPTLPHLSDDDGEETPTKTVPMMRPPPSIDRVVTFDRVHPSVPLGRPALDGELPKSDPPDDAA